MPGLLGTSPETVAGRAGRGGSQWSTSLLRSVGAQLVFTKRVGPQLPGSEAVALRVAGPQQAAGGGWQKPLSPARSRGHTTTGRVLGNEGPAARW